MWTQSKAICKVEDSDCFRDPKTFSDHLRVSYRLENYAFTWLLGFVFQFGITTETMAKRRPARDGRWNNSAEANPSSRSSPARTDLTRRRE
ncbi:hypothetical protein L596_020421 [Steinernema carpocapsae]|uniref:Uncharacterized protein n=1 Tax=Steinernema carpocapsae TaxID=34508 RepID=A0A4V6XW01_STECR|nr:hypothetical protein L596_020421 [Steinernema carpocapsae]